MNDFHGYPIHRLSSKFLELDCLATAGPRIVRLKYKGSDNLLAEVPEISIPTPYGEYHYLGGHRLWYAPESFPRAYIPDGEGLVAMDLADGLMLDGRVEPATGIHKRLEVHLHPDEPRVELTHTLINEGLWDAELSPWAITMFRLGGTAILPNQAETHSANDLLPNRHFSLWLYSHINDPRLQLEDGFILVRAKPNLPLFKIGTFNPNGWIAYWLGDVLFCKTFGVHAGLCHPDYDCNAEIYCDSHFIELESLGPLSRLAPGDSVSFKETWEFYDTLEQGFLSERMIELITKET
jgi:hypothetical protein